MYPSQNEVSLYPFYRWRNWGFGDPKLSQSPSGKWTGQIWAQVSPAPGLVPTVTHDHSPHLLWLQTSLLQGLGEFNTELSAQKPASWEPLTQPWHCCFWWYTSGRALAPTPHQVIRDHSFCSIFQPACQSTSQADHTKISWARMKLNPPMALLTGSRQELDLSRDSCLSMATGHPRRQSSYFGHGGWILVNEEAHTLEEVQKAY